MILYDRVADRWFVSRFAQDQTGGPNNNAWYECFAISTTPDPTGTYYRYAFQIHASEFNDYPKFGIWPDAYYMTAQRNKIFPGLGLFAAAFERTKMLAGDPSPQMVLFSIDNNGHRAGMLPADGTTGARQASATGCRRVCRDDLSRVPRSARRRPLVQRTRGGAVNAAAGDLDRRLVRSAVGGGWRLRESVRCPWRAAAARPGTHA